MLMSALTRFTCVIPATDDAQKLMQSQMAMQMGGMGADPAKVHQPPPPTTHHPPRPGQPTSLIRGDRLIDLLVVFIPMGDVQKPDKGFYGGHQVGLIMWLQNLITLSFWDFLLDFFVGCFCVAIMEVIHHPPLFTRLQMLAAEKDSLELMQHHWLTPRCEKRAIDILKERLKAP